MSTSIDMNELSKSMNDVFHKDKSIDELANELYELANDQNNLSLKWLSTFKAIEALRLILSICHKTNVDLNKFIRISID